MLINLIIKLPLSSFVTQQTLVLLVCVLLVGFFGRTGVTGGECEGTHGGGGAIFFGVIFCFRLLPPSLCYSSLLESFHCYY